MSLYVASYCCLDLTYSHRMLVLHVQPRGRVVGPWTKDQEILRQRGLADVHAFQSIGYVRTNSTYSLLVSTPHKLYGESTQAQRKQIVVQPSAYTPARVDVPCESTELTFELRTTFDKMSCWLNRSHVYHSRRRGEIPGLDREFLNTRRHPAYRPRAEGRPPPRVELSACRQCIGQESGVRARRRRRFRHYTRRAKILSR